MELENKDPTAELVSLPLGFLRSITDDFGAERELGKGAYGVVYKGILPCGSVIAVKKFNGGILAGDDRSFENEASSLMDIKHHNVVQLLGFCTEPMGQMMMKQPNGKVVVVEEQTRVLCFEYICNGDLYNYLSDESLGLDWNMRYKIIKGICSGLKYLHGRNIIHLDLKPQNILMDTTMMPKIADFGLSRLLGEQKSYIVAATSNRPGTLGYMAPEYIDRGLITKKADIFSLGVIIIEILTGRKDDYPYYHQSNDVFQGFIEKVLNNWRKRFERSSKYTALELHTHLVKQCISIALECVDPKKEKRPNVSNIIEILDAAERSCYVQNGEDLLVDHQGMKFQPLSSGNRAQLRVIDTNECHEMGTQEGLLTSGVLRADVLVDLNKIALKDHAQAWITKGIMKSAVALLQPQHEPVLESVVGSLCYPGSRYASFWVAHKALTALEDNMLKDWAATINLGPDIKALRLELLFVKAFLESTLGKVIHNSTLQQCLMMLQDLIYGAEDVVDEMEYFHIQDMLDGGQHAEGCTRNLDLNVSPCSPRSSFHDGDNCNYDDDDDDDDDDDVDDDDDDDNDDNNNYDSDDNNYDYDDDDNNSPEFPSVHDEPQKLRFDRDNASQRIKQIVEQIRLKRQEVSSAIKLLGTDWCTAPNIAQSRPITISESIELKLYGRELMMKRIIDDITKGKHFGEVLTVIPIVGPGGIGKTTLAQHIYHSGEVQQHFDVRVWTCVSLNFNVNKLEEEIQRYIPKDDHESSNGTTSELIGQRLKHKRFLLVLDDIWDCNDEDEWKRLLVPFRKSQVQGNIIIVTTRFPSQAGKMVQKNDHSEYLKGIENKEFKELFLEIIFGDDDNFRKDHEFLLEIGFKIVDKLKGSPLAAKTVGRLLKSKLDMDHWKRILESKEWEHSDGKNDIMPALKLSFDYLHPQLQQCFSYCALFPQDYQFEREEIINFWIGLEVLHPSHGENKRVEDIGQSHLIELVNNGFLEKKANKNGKTCYIIHDLLHDLARKVSSLECLTIDISQSEVIPLEVLPTIHHLSINISVKDRPTLKNSMEYFNTLDTRLKVEKLRTLMIFGEHHGCLVKAFGDLFREAKGLRVIFISGASYDMKDLLHNFYCLIHLRYLRIESFTLHEARFPNKISRFYHMKVLDAKYCDIIDDRLPRDINNLVKLRHLLVQDDTVHSSITEVGKLKSLQELRRFVVKQDDQGFKLREIGHLKELCGLLSIYNLQKVEVEEEASKAKLLEKSHLHELILHWDNIDSSNNGSTLEGHVLERLKPHSNLLKLSIKGHRGTTCPSWLGTNLSIKSLESLCLDGVAWQTFPPIGELLLVNVPHGELSSNMPKERFRKLKKLELCNLTMVQKWAVHAPCQLFPFLEVLIIKDCPQLVELSFQHIACCQQGKEVNVNLFPRLSKLKITNCPQLLSFPPVPWSAAPCSINIEGTGSSSLDKLVCEKGKRQGYSLDIQGKKDTIDSMFWNVLAFHNLTGLKQLRVHSVEPPPLHCLQMLSSLRILMMSCWGKTISFVEADIHVKYQFPVEWLAIKECNASGKELTQLLTYFPKLLYLQLDHCDMVTGVSVNVTGQQAMTETPGPSSSSSSDNKLGPRAEDETVASEEAEQGLFLLPPQLQVLKIFHCPELSLRSNNPHGGMNEDGRTGGLGEGGLQALSSLRGLEIICCPKLLSAYSSSSFSSSSFPFPNSLEDLDIYGEVVTEVLLPLSNLTSLTSLSIVQCGDLRGEGLLSLLAQGCLTKLSIERTPNFFLDSEPAQSQEIPCCSSKLQELQIDDVAGFTAAFLGRSLLFSSIATLEISRDCKVDRFREDHEPLLFVNSLEKIRFWDCSSLQYLPARLHSLPNLKTLMIQGCHSIQILPEDALPSSLQQLVISICPEIRTLPRFCSPCSLQKLHISRCAAILVLPEDALPSSLQEFAICSCPQLRSLPKNCLPGSLQKLFIANCPAIQSLPEVDDLPSSLQEIDVSGYNNSEELRNQCRKFINVIPIVRA